MITIRKYTEADKTNWDYYVMQHPQGTIFHLTRWKKVIEKAFGHKSYYLIAAENIVGRGQKSEIREQRTETRNPVVGILPLFRIRSFIFGNYLVSVPFAELGGILADDKDVERMLLDRAIKMAEEMECDYIELRNQEQIKNFPVKSLYYNFRREIYSDPDQNMQAIPRKARRMIRRGIKFGLYSEFGIHLFHDFYEILAKSYHQLGTPIFSKKFFRTFLDEFGTDAQILVVYDKNGTSVAGVLSFFYKDQVLPFYAGSLFEYRKLSPNDFMYWELMSYGSENGYKIFDFGRSKIDTGSYHFKRHWGFKPVPLFYQYHLNRINELPNLSPANPKYQKKIKLWKKMPFKVTKILGPPIAKYLA